MRETRSLWTGGGVRSLCMIQVVLWLTFAAVTSAFVLPPHHAARVAESRPGGMVAWAAPSPFSNLLQEVFDDPSPLLITIGPQCCGKTTMLRRLNASRAEDAPPLRDVAIDMDREVYRRVRLETFMGGSGGVEGDGVLKRSLYNKPMAERIMEPGNNEARLVLSFLTGEMTLGQVMDRVERMPSMEGVREEFMGALQRAEAYKPDIKTKWYRLFVPEAIPKAVRRSNEMLGQVLLEHDGPVAWGNTNSKPSDYKAALSMAEEAGRRVVYLRWGQEFKPVPLEELLSRNMLRLTKMGRYIPALSIKTALERSQRLIQTSQNGDPSLLTSLAGFLLDNPRTQPRSSLPLPQDRAPDIRPIPASDITYRPPRTMQSRHTTGGALPLVMEEEVSWRSVLARAAHDAMRALQDFGVALEESDVLAQTCLRMGKEWSKMKAWSKNAYKMEERWRLDYVEAYNRTRNSSSQGIEDDRFFDWEKWEIIRTLTGWGKRF